MALRAIFIGSDNSFSELLVDWLAAHTTLAGVVWVPAYEWKRTWRGRIAFLTNRFARYGFGKTLNEVLFYAAYHTLSAQEDGRQIRELIDTYRRETYLPRWNGPFLRTVNPNTQATLDFIRSLSPDLGIATCVHAYFQTPLRQSTQMGIFVLHEGLLPEYRGLYSPFWAWHNVDPAGVGASMVRVNERWDAGDVYVRAPMWDVDQCERHHGFVGHRAVLMSLPRVREVLELLAQGTAQPLDLRGRRAGYYTYPGISDAIRARLRWRLARRADAKVAGNALDDDG